MQKRLCLLISRRYVMMGSMVIVNRCSIRIYGLAISSMTDTPIASFLPNLQFKNQNYTFLVTLYFHQILSQEFYLGLYTYLMSNCQYQFKLRSIYQMLNWNIIISNVNLNSNHLCQLYETIKIYLQNIRLFLQQYQIDLKNIKQLFKSMDMFRRIGTQKKKFKVQFFIGRLKFSSFKAGKIYIVIKRGDRKAKSQQKLQMSEDNKLNFNKQILEIQVTLFFDQKQNKYQQKLGQLNVVLLDEKQNKVLLGMVHFDVAQYANSGQQSIKQKKKLQQTPKRLQGLLQYNVFVKYIGQGSQSSIDKIGDFFFGKSKQQIQTQKNNTKQKAKQGQVKNKKKRNNSSDQKQQSPQQQQKPSKNDKNKQKDKQKIKSMGKTQIKKVKQNDQLKVDVKMPKNYVTAGKNGTQNSYLTSDNDDQNTKNSFYFDEPQTDKQPQNSIKNKKRSISMQKLQKTLTDKQSKGKKIVNKKNKDQSESQQSGSQGQEDVQISQVQPVDGNTMFKKFYQAPASENQANKQRKTPITAQTALTQSPKFKPVQAIKCRPVQSANLTLQTCPSSPSNLLQQNQSLRSRLQQSQLQSRSLKKQISQHKIQLTQLTTQVQQYQQQITHYQQQLLKQRSTIENFTIGSTEIVEAERRRMEKEKNQLLVENSRLKEKCKQDFRKMEQVGAQRQEQLRQHAETARAEMHRLKQECSSYRDKLDKGTKERHERVGEISRQKNQNKNLQLEVTELKTALSRIKLRICTLLNDALAKNQDYTIQLLMGLNKD